MKASYKILRKTHLSLEIFIKLIYLRFLTYIHMCGLSESYSVMPYSLRPHELYSPRILQATILEWVAFYVFRRSSQPRDQTQVSNIAGGIFTS